MKKFVMLAAVLSASIAFAAAHTDAQLLAALKAGAADGTIEVMAIENSIDPSELVGDIAKDFDKKSEFADAGTLKVLGETLFIYQDLVDGGNGCYRLYNPQGKFLDAICGTESSEWNWDSDSN